MSYNKGVKPFATGKVLLGTLEFATKEHPEKRMTVSAEIVGKDLHIFFNGEAYAVKREILFIKSIKECIHDIITNGKNISEETASEVAATDPQGDTDGAR